MTTLQTLRQKFEQRWLWRCVGLSLGLVVVMLLGRSSAAEFELPYINTTNALANVELRGVWSFNRGFVRPSDNMANDAYEAYAVGIDPSVTDVSTCGSGATTTDDCNGAFYFFNGSTWSRVPTPFKDGAKTWAMNDVVGQYDHGYGNDSVLITVGVKSQIAMLMTYQQSIGAVSNSDDGRFRQANVVCPASFAGCDTAYKSARDFLAVDAAQSYATRVIAGGTKGLIAYSGGLNQGTNPFKDWTIVDPTTVGVGTDENITDIQFVNLTTAYVTTSTFKNGVLDRTCANNAAAPLQQVSRLYRVDSVTSTWSKLAEVTGTCFYGLSVGLRDTTPADHGPQKNVIWVASYNGVYKVEETTTTPTLTAPTPGSSPIYSVVAIQDRGGYQQTLIANGNFESWTSANPDVNNPWVEPSTWLSFGENTIGRNNDAGQCYAVGQAFCTNNTNPADKTTDCTGFANGTTCATGYTCRVPKHCSVTTTTDCTNNAAICPSGETCKADYVPTGNNNDLHISNEVRPGSTGQYSVRVWPGAYYGSGDQCLNRQSATATFSTGYTTRIPLSTIEGQKFKVSGWYKVEFPATAPGDPTPVSPEGGIYTQCFGAYNPRTIDCSLNNRSLMRTAGHPTSGDTNQVNGWVPFSLILSREDLIFGDDPTIHVPIVRTPGVRATQRKMGLEIICGATYGAKVWCDDLKIEELSDPAIPWRDNYTVIAAGKDIATNGMLVNTNALYTNSFSKEAVPNGVRTGMPNTVNQVNAMYAVGLQHVFAVGQALDATAGNATKGVAIFQRTPSTLTGTMWVGASSPTGATQALAAGPISVSCVSAEAGLPTLCQSSPESYGISLNITSLYTDTRLGNLTGRAWYGKSKTADNTDTETLNLGSCLNAPQYLPNAGSNKYNLTGVCDTYARRCKTTAGGALSAVSCVSDINCYGRCQGDQGFLCVSDADCQIKTDSFDGPFNASSATSKLKVLPAQRLVCGATVSGVPASPLACSPIGWLTFESKDVTDTPPSGAFGVKYNTLYTTPTVATSHNSLYQLANQGAHELSGWARFLSLASAPGGGWVHLRDSSPAVTGTGKLYACRDCNGAAKDQMTCAFCQDEQSRSCVPSNDGVGAAQCYYECQDDAAHTHCAANPDCVGHGSGVCAPPSFCSGNGTTRCSTDTECATAGGTCMSGAVCKTTGSQCVKYGVNLDTESGKFFGSAWSSDLGWIDFRGVTYGGKRIIQTKLGDIYATGNIGAQGIDQSQGGATCNSTYLITSAKSITGFCSAVSGTVSGATQENVSEIPLISAENSYQNVLGRFDIKGIETKTNPACTTNCVNKYGSTIVSANDPSSGNLTDSVNSNSFISRLAGNNNILGGKVYIASGQTDYTIGQALNFTNSSDLVSRGSGAGILIVNGNLTINQGMTYTTAAAADLRQLASLTVVVKGNLTIDNRVTNIVGAYYVSGTVKTTSNPSNDNQYPLRVDGLMIASKFEFKRQFAGTIERPEASELIVYDGRLQSNPMPGMADFTSALPNAIRNLP